jgi:hypothetical protein
MTFPARRAFFCALRAPLLAVSLLICVACATARTDGGSTTPDQLSAQDLRSAARSADEPVYEILVRLRPQWLIAPTGEPAPVVFVDGVETGAVATLQVIGSSRVATVRLLPPPTAASRYAVGGGGSVIEVLLSR